MSSNVTRLSASQTIESLSQGGGSDGRSLIRPYNAAYYSSNGSATGYLKVTLPVSWVSEMIMLTVDIYMYGEGMTTLRMGGYNYSVSSSWINAQSHIVSTSPHTNISSYKIEFGHDGSTCAIYISHNAEAGASTWTYPQVVVRDVHIGYSTAIDSWGDAWDIEFTATLGTITATKTVTNDNPILGGGSGVANKVAYWSDTESLTYDINFHYESGVLCLGTTDAQYGSLRIGTDGANEGVTIFDGVGATFRMWRQSNVGLITRGTGATAGIALDSVGKVGLGTTTPSQLLELYADNARISFKDAGGTQGLITGLLSGGEGYIQGNNASGAAQFTLRADSGDSYVLGDFGVGTSSPSYKLHVSGTSFFQTGNVNVRDVNLVVGTTGGSTNAIYFQQTSYSDWLAYRTNNAFYITQAGTSGSEFVIGGDGSSYTNAFVTIGDSIKLDSNDTSGASYILSDLGIGTSTPTYKLDISGTLRTTDLASFDKGLRISGSANEVFEFNVGTSNLFDDRFNLWPTGGAQLISNCEFYSDMSGFGTYDNAGSGAVTRTLVADAAAPNSSSNVMRITYTTGIGTPSPGYGGFNVGITETSYERGDIIFWRILANIPSGRTLEWASNNYGSEVFSNWVTDKGGIGEWKEYIFVQKIGQTGSFSSTGFFYISGGADATFSWDVARLTAETPFRPEAIFRNNNRLYWKTYNQRFVFSNNASGGTSGYVPYFDSADTFDITNIYYSGSTVGVGTSSPSEKFHVYSSTNGDAGIRITNPNVGTSARTRLYFESDAASGGLYLTSAGYTGVSGWADRFIMNTDSATSGGILIHSSTGGVQLSASGTDAKDVYVNTSGNVGIGTGSPAYKLDVSGNGRFTSDLIANSAKIGGWTGDSSYKGLFHSSQTGDEYIIMSDDTNTFISTSTGGDVFIRGGNNVSTHQIVVYPDQRATASGSPILTQADEGSGNGLDADTLDGVQGASYLRSDTNDTFNGNTLTIDSSVGTISRSNLNNSHFLIGSTSAGIGMDVNEIICSNNLLIVGTSTAHSLEFCTDATARAYINTNGDFYPNQSGSQNLGGNANRWSEFFSVYVGANAGTAAAPTFRFNDDTNTGFYSSGSGNGFSATVDGTQTARFYSGGLGVTAQAFSIFGPSYLLSAGGGRKVSGTSSDTGYLKVAFPVDWPNTMISFWLDVFDYVAHQTISFYIAGYLYSSGSTWTRENAQIIADYDNPLLYYKVEFAHDGSVPCIYISKTDQGASTGWSYCAAWVRDVSMNQTNTSYTTWATGWAVTLDDGTGKDTKLTVNVYPNNAKRSTGDFTIGDGSAQSRLLIQKADNDVSDHIIFYNGTTRVGEIGVEDTTWLRINQETANNIYTPRYIRADQGFFVDGISKGIDGNGNFIGGTIAGASDYDTLLRSDTADTATGFIDFDGGLGVTASAEGQFVLRRNTSSTTGDDITSFYQDDAGLIIVIDNENDADTGKFAVYYKATGNQELLHAEPNDFRYKGNTVWHSGNDGSGSGLDADLLDGYNSSSSATANTIALRDGSGHLYMNYGFSAYLNMTHSSSTRSSDTVFFSTVDNYIRKNDATGMRASLNVPTRTGGDASGTWGIGVTGNAGSATVLQTARTINGTSFNGSANITTANWGTSRTLTIGNTGKSVNGSGNVSWSLTEIGAPSTTGTGASGTWGISITGNAATATTATDAGTLDGIDSTAFINNTAQSESAAANIAVGWYTIATNTGDRAMARFGVRDTRSGRHQVLVFYASHMFGTEDAITLLHNNSFASSDVISKIRIKSGSTYDGAALQVYVSDASNTLVVYLLGDNFQSSGWVLKDWIPDATDPSDLTNYGSMTTGAETNDFSSYPAGSMVTTGELWVRRPSFTTIQYQVLTTANISGTSGKIPKSVGNNSLTDSIITEDTGKIGINDATPSYTLDVNGTGRFTGYLYTDSRLYVDNTTNYLSYPTGNYGSIQINGSGAASWEGFSIDGRAVFMHDGGTQYGLYDDVNNQWGFYGTLNGKTDMRYAGSVKLETTNTGIDVTGNIAQTGLFLYMDTNIEVIGIDGGNKVFIHAGVINNTTTSDGIAINFNTNGTGGGANIDFYADSTSTVSTRRGRVRGDNGNWAIGNNAGDSTHRLVVNDTTDTGGSLMKIGGALGIAGTAGTNSSRLHIDANGSDPCISIKDEVIDAVTSSTGKTFHGWMQITIDGVTRYIQLYA